MRLVGSSRWIAVLAFLVCLTSASFAKTSQVPASASWISGAASISASSTLLTLQPATLVFNGPGKPGNNKDDNNKKRKKDGGGGIVAVPEGGSAFFYLGLAGLACLGALYFTRRRTLENQPTAS